MMPLDARAPFDLGASLRFLGRTLGERELRELAARHGPWQGHWAHHLRAAG